MVSFEGAGGGLAWVQIMANESKCLGSCFSEEKI